MKTIIAAAVFVPFTAFTAWLLAQHGFVGFFEIVLATAAGWQVFIDLAISLTLVLGFVRGHAKRNGLVWWPFALLTLVLGSIGPLAYFIYAGLRSRTAQ